MATLSEKKPDNLKESQFGLPEERKYPMPDESHARNAKARAAPPELTEGTLALPSGAHCERAASEGGSGMVKSSRATWEGSRCRRCAIGRMRSCHATTV